SRSAATAACRPPGPGEVLAAVERGDARAVERLLRRGADPNATGGQPPRTALSLAAERGGSPDRAPTAPLPTARVTRRSPPPRRRAAPIASGVSSPRTSRALRRSPRRGSSGQ